jgi:hypothetical protein
LFQYYKSLIKCLYEYKYQEVFGLYQVLP